MGRAGTGQKLLSMAALVMLVVGIQSVLAPAAGAARSDEIRAGNPSCADLGYALEAKDDDGREVNEPKPHSSTAPDPTNAAEDDPAHVDDDGNVLIVDYTFTADGKFDFTIDSTSDYLVDAVIIKQGDDVKIYRYDPAVSSDTGLEEHPTTANAYSHISFCADPSTTGGASSVTIAKTNDANQDSDNTFSEDETAATAEQDVEFQLVIENTGATELTVQSLVDEYGSTDENLLDGTPALSCTRGGSQATVDAGAKLPAGSTTTCTFTLADYSPAAGQSIQNKVTLGTDKAAEVSDTSVVRTRSAGGPSFIPPEPTPAECPEGTEPTEAYDGDETIEPGECEEPCPDGTEPDGQGGCLAVEGDDTTNPEQPSDPPPAATPDGDPTVEPDAAPAPQPETGPTVRGDAVRRLPETGYDPVELASVGAALLVAGAVLTGRSRRRLRTSH